MIKDSETNFVYIADSLANKYPAFNKKFKKVLETAKLKFDLLPHTKDVWAVDYMPIQRGVNDFIQFVYNPDYLKGAVGTSTISDVTTICNLIGMSPTASKIVLDGGNVIRSSNTIIMCDKVFRENPRVKPLKLISRLYEIFEVNKIVFIPTHPYDFTGHSDGMVRFLDDNTVLINDYSKEKKEFKLGLHLALHNANLDWIEIPYNPYFNKSYYHAHGEYINYLQVGQNIIVPTFKMKEDNVVVKKFESLFPRSNIYTINSNEIANDGGLLNCITWNIKL